MKKTKKKKAFATKKIKRGRPPKDETGSKVDRVAAGKPPSTGKRLGRPPLPKNKARTNSFGISVGKRKKRGRPSLDQTAKKGKEKGDDTGTKVASAKVSAPGSGRKSAKLSAKEGKSIAAAKRNFVKKNHRMLNRAALKIAPNVKKPKKIMGLCADLLQHQGNSVLAHIHRARVIKAIQAEAQCAAELIPNALVQAGFPCEKFSESWFSRACSADKVLDRNPLVLEHFSNFEKIAALVKATDDQLTQIAESGMLSGYKLNKLRRNDIAKVICNKSIKGKDGDAPESLETLQRKTKSSDRALLKKLLSIPLALSERGQQNGAVKIMLVAKDFATTCDLEIPDEYREILTTELGQTQNNPEAQWGKSDHSTTKSPLIMDAEHYAKARVAEMAKRSANFSATEPG